MMKSDVERNKKDEKHEKLREMGKTKTTIKK